MSQNTQSHSTAHELSCAYVLACDAYKAAYRITLANGDKPIAERGDDTLALEAAATVMCDAKRAMDAALKVAA